MAVGVPAGRLCFINPAAAAGDPATAGPSPLNSRPPKPWRRRPQLLHESAIMLSINAAAGDRSVATVSSPSRAQSAAGRRRSTMGTSSLNKMKSRRGRSTCARRGSQARHSFALGATADKCLLRQGSGAVSFARLRRSGGVDRFFRGPSVLMLAPIANSYRVAQHKSSGEHTRPGCRARRPRRAPGERKARCHVVAPPIDDGDIAPFAALNLCRS